MVGQKKHEKDEQNMVIILLFFFVRYQTIESMSIGHKMNLIYGLGCIEIRCRSLLLILRIFLILLKNEKKRKSRSNSIWLVDKFITHRFR